MIFLFPLIFIAIRSIPLVILCLSAEDMCAMTPDQMEEYEQRRRCKKRGVMIFYVVFLFIYVTFAIFDAMGVKMNGYLCTWDVIGKQEIDIKNLNYAISPDRTEIVLNYDIVTKSFDSWASITSGGAPVSSPTSSVPAETRIPLDPMPDGIAKCFIQVDYDSAPVQRAGGTRIDYSRTTWLVNADGLRTLPCCTDFQLAGEMNKIRFSRATLRGTLPDGLEYRLVLHPKDEPLLSGVFACREKTSNAIILMFPYDRDGDRYVMLSSMSAGRGSSVFFQQIKQEHPEVLTTTRDTGFLTWCKRILLVPLGFLIDMIFFFLELPIILLMFRAFG